jgi:hypothetical protein
MAFRGRGVGHAAWALAVCLGCRAQGGEGDGDGGTGGDGDGGGDCEGQGVAPATPTIVRPTAADVFAPWLVLESSAFVDADPGDAHQASEFEVWIVDGDELLAVVWRAEVTEPADLLAVTLADGTFEVGSRLDDRTTYAVRVRHRDSSAPCEVWSEWSEPRLFATDDSLYIWDPNAIHTFEIEIPPESWGPINAEAVAPGCVQFERQYHTGTLRFEGQVFDGVGIRAKGGCGSSRDLNGKAAFKVNLEWDDPAVPGCPPSRRLYGLKNLTFNNGIQDSTGIHERMAYRYYLAAGVVAPRAVNARLEVNGEYWGLYILVETIDRPFIKRWFPNSRGMMYEGSYWCDLVEENVPLQLDGETCFQREFVPGECDGPPDPGDDAQDWELLRQLTQRIAAIPPGGLFTALPSFFEFDALLTMAAVESVVAHWDGYPWELNNNYRVYHDPVLDRWTMIPWGTDQTFIDEFDPWQMATGVISVPCLQDPACEAAFAGRVHDMLDLYEQLNFGRQAASMRDQIAVHVQEDPRKEYSYAEWEGLISHTLDWIGQRPEVVRQILAAHGY